MKRYIILVGLLIPEAIEAAIEASLIFFFVVLFCGVDSRQF